jgi:hypothetical protein
MERGAACGRDHAGRVRDFVVISSPDALKQLENCLGDGRRWGISFEYVAQPSPRGIADAFLVAERQLSGCAAALALGDNIFYGTGLPQRIRQAMAGNPGGNLRLRIARSVFLRGRYLRRRGAADRPRGKAEKVGVELCCSGTLFFTARRLNGTKRSCREAID